MKTTITRRQCIGLGVGLGLVTLSPGAARADELTDVLDEIAKARRGLTSLVGPFVQVRKLGLLATEVRSNGQMMLLSPDRLRWELLPPDEVTYFIGPEGLGYKSKHGQGRLPANSTSSRIASALDDLRTILAGDLAKLRERYDLKLVQKVGDGSVTLEAVPKTKLPSRITKVTLTLGPDKIRPTHARLLEGEKDATDISFGDLKKNTAVDVGLLKVP